MTRIRIPTSGRRDLTIVAALVAAAALAAPALAAPPVIRFDGVGPLRLGMTLADARATGWLAHKTTGCALEMPRPVVYSLDGTRAPAALDGFATFRAGRLSTVAVNAGGRTKLGVAPGKTTVAAMVAVYRRAGFRVTREYSDVFQATFVGVSRAGREMSGMATGSIVDTISVPTAEVCD